MKITREQKETAKEMYLRSFDNRDIMAKLNLTSNQLQWVINRINLNNTHTKENIK